MLRRVTRHAARARKCLSRVRAAVHARTRWDNGFFNGWAINCQFGCCCSNSCQLTQFCRYILRLSDTFGHLLYELLRAWKFRNISFLFRSKNILPELFTNIAEHTNPSVMLQVKSRVLAPFCWKLIQPWYEMLFLSWLRLIFEFGKSHFSNVLCKNSQKKRFNAPFRGVSMALQCLLVWRREKSCTGQFQKGGKLKRDNLGKPSPNI